MNITATQLESRLTIRRTPCNLAQDHFKLRAAADRALAQLDNLIGIEPVKRQLSGLADVMLIDRLRHEGQNTFLPPHFVFAGNPGTGKTSVAKALAEILHGIGCLKKPLLRTVNRAQLIDRFIGGTAPRVNEAVDGAMGGVLFIDEAYALVPRDSDRDFGHEAVATLLERMENDRGHFVCVAAGYPKEMRSFLDSNPGLGSRFTRWIDFPNFSPAELMEILVAMARERHLSLTDRAQELLWPVLKEATLEPGFANARTARALLDEIVVLQARRLSEWDGFPSQVALRQISAEDVEALQTQRQQRSLFEVIRTAEVVRTVVASPGLSASTAPRLLTSGQVSSDSGTFVVPSNPSSVRNISSLAQISLLVAVLATLIWLQAQAPLALIDTAHPSRATILLLWLAIPLLLAPQVIRLHDRWSRKAWLSGSRAMTLPVGIRRWLQFVRGIYGLAFKAIANVLAAVVLFGSVLVILYWSAQGVLAAWRAWS